jgi:hypothetical protein
VLLLGDMRRLYGLNLCVLTIDRLPEVGASVVLDAGAEEVRRHRDRRQKLVELVWNGGDKYNRAKRYTVTIDGHPMELEQHGRNLRLLGDATPLYTFEKIEADSVM